MPNGDDGLDALRYELSRQFYALVSEGAGSARPSSAWSGWSSEAGQLRAYRHFLAHFEVGGDVIDLGCADGRLLRFLLDEVPCALTPHGVDFVAEAIAAARAGQLAAFAANLHVANVAAFNPAPQTFAYVIANPCYVLAEERSRCLLRWLSWLDLGGRLLLYEYRGSPGYHTLHADCVRAGLPEPLEFGSDEVMLVRVERPCP